MSRRRETRDAGATPTFALSGHPLTHAQLPLRVCALDSLRSYEREALRGETHGPP